MTALLFRDRAHTTYPEKGEGGLEKHYAGTQVGRGFKAWVRSIFRRESLDELPIAFTPSVFFRRESLDELHIAFTPSVFFSIHYPYGNFVAL